MAERCVPYSSLTVYVAFWVYPSISLGLLRSFAEHRADSDVRRRTRVVEAGPFWSLIFLNNNLHIAHHVHPAAPWYQLPRLWAAMRATVTQPDLIVAGSGPIGTGQGVFQRRHRQRLAPTKR